MEILGKTPINPVLFVTGKICGYLTWIFLGEAFIDAGNYRNNLYLKYISLLLLTWGIVFIAVSSFYLGKAIRLGLPTTGTKLKTSNIYSISRNPMYLGLNLITLSAMLYTMNIVVLITGLYSIIIYHLIILGEEKFLGKRFGESYADYKKRTRRYL